MTRHKAPPPWPLGLLLGSIVAVADVVLNRRLEAVLAEGPTASAGRAFHITQTDLGHVGAGPAAILALAGTIALVGLGLARERMTAAAFGLVFGGVFGNFLDAAAAGRARDLVSGHLFGLEAPLNVSDLSIVLGGLLLGVSVLRRARRK